MKPPCARWACLLPVVTAATLLSCSTTGRGLRPEGDIVQVRLSSGEVCTGELLLVRDSTVVLRGREARTLSFGEVRDVTVRGYQNHIWQPMVLLFEVAPAIVLGMVASGGYADAWGVAAIALIPAVVNSIAFATSTPAPPWVEGPLTPALADSLRKYARFPLGLEEDRLKRFLRGTTPE